MNLPFFASFMLFIIWLTYTISKRRRTDAQIVHDFWEQERLANQTRRQPLDNLDYITLPLQNLPMNTMAEDEVVQDCLDTIRSLSECKIVNLTGITNTELKLQFGVPNLPRLTEYDQNYTRLVRTLQKWADRLYAQNYYEEACTVLEFAVATGTDISATYSLLAKLYHMQGYPSKIQNLITAAQALRSASRSRIVRTLQESDPYSDSPDCG